MKSKIERGSIVRIKRWFGNSGLKIVSGLIGDYALVDEYLWSQEDNMIRHCKLVKIQQLLLLPTITNN